MQRIDKDTYYLRIAQSVCERSTCLRRRYGAVIVKNDEIIATGYNGSARGVPNCCDVGECWRESHGVPHGEQYEKCLGVHAEQNAIISARRADMIGSTLYLYGEEHEHHYWSVMKDLKPCEICDRMIRNAGIAKVVTAFGETVYNF